MPWHQLSLVVSEDQITAAETALETLGALSITLGDAGDEPQLEPPPGATPVWPKTRLTALFPGEIDPKALQGAAAGALAGIGGAHLTLEPLHDRCWERVWLDAFHPMQFGARLWICPAGQKPPAADAVILELDPGLAFGTGHHPTTALCLRWLDAANLRGRTLVDYGCGSGILALAALRLGAARAIAVDHDPQALEATAANAAKNGLADRIQVCPPASLPVETADLVVANILAAPLIELAPTFAALVRPEGQLVLSGILADQARTVADAYRGHFALAEPVLQDGWARLEGKRLPACH